MNRYTILLFAFIVLWTSGCDTIKEGDYLIDYIPPIPEGADMRRVLLEDYTGVQCSNCPKAAEKSSLLKQSYGDRLVVVSVHAGYFARPLGGYDLRTSAGNDYDAYYKISGNPKGVINRTNYQGAAFHSVNQWDEVIQYMPTQSPVSLNLQVLYKPQTRTYSVDIKMTRYHAYEGEPLNMVLWLVEDNIPTWQIIENGTIDKEYIQQHVLRGALNGSWGEPIALPDGIGQSATISKGSYALPDSFKENDCSIVAFISGQNSKEILQVNTVPLMEIVEIRN